MKYVAQLTNYVETLFQLVLLFHNTHIHLLHTRIHLLHTHTSSIAHTMDEGVPPPPSSPLYGYQYPYAPPPPTSGAQGIHYPSQNPHHLGARAPRGQQK